MRDFWGFLFRLCKVAYTFRLLLPVVPVQPFANEVANNICRNRNKKSDYKICHRTSPPFCWRFGSLGIISHIFTLQNNFFMFYLSDGMTFEVLQSLFLQAHFYIHRSFCPQLDSSNIHPLIVLNADALSFASQLFIGTETNITINKESLMHFLFYEKLFMDFEIQSVSDLFSILFKMEGQTDLEIATSKDLANLSEDSDNEYSYAAEPPVQFRLSHLSRRSEPL